MPSRTQKNISLLRSTCLYSREFESYQLQWKKSVNQKTPRIAMKYNGSGNVLYRGVICHVIYCNFNSAHQQWLSSLEAWILENRYHKWIKWRFWVLESQRNEKLWVKLKQLPFTVHRLSDEWHKTNETGVIHSFYSLHRLILVSANLVMLLGPWYFCFFF